MIQTVEILASTTYEAAQARVFLEHNLAEFLSCQHATNYGNTITPKVRNHAVMVTGDAAFHVFRADAVDTRIADFVDLDKGWVFDLGVKVGGDALRMRRRASYSVTPFFAPFAGAGRNNQRACCHDKNRFVAMQ